MDRTALRQKVRRDAFKILRDRFRSNVEMSEALGEGFAPSFVSQLLNGHRGIGDDVATKIEERLGLSMGCLDQIPGTETAPGQSVANHQPTLEQEIDALLEKATPKSRGDLKKIAAAVSQGLLTEDDLALLRRIAERFSNKG